MNVTDELFVVHGVKSWVFISRVFGFWVASIHLIPRLQYAVMYDE